MTGAELCATADIHPAYAEHAERYTRATQMELIVWAASRLRQDRFATGGGIVTATVDDKLLTRGLT